MGESRKAILIQIYTAIIACLLLRAMRNLFGGKIALPLKDLAVLCWTGLSQPVHFGPATPMSSHPIKRFCRYAQVTTNSQDSNEVVLAASENALIPY